MSPALPDAVLRRVFAKANQLLRSDSKAAMQRRIASELDRAGTLPQREYPVRLRLPIPYGKGLPERVVELLIARLSYRAGLNVLDVGHAYAMQSHLHMLRSLPCPKHLTGIDIAPPPYDSKPFYQASILGDITRSSVADQTFDLIWCISALEHFGMDNSAYTPEFDRLGGQDARALSEMVRLLVPGGVLVVTVPYGRYEDHGTQTNYDAQRWQALLETVRSRVRIVEMYFRHTFIAGWAQADPKELQFVGYFDQANAGAGAIAVAHITKNGGQDSSVSTARTS